MVHVAPPAVMALLKKMKKDSDGCLEHAYVMQPITGERLLTWKTMQTSMKQVRLVLDNGLSGAADPSETFQGGSGSLNQRQQLQLPFASTGLAGQQGCAPVFSNAEAELPGLQG